MASITDLIGRGTTHEDKGKSPFGDSNVNVYEWDVVPYNDIIEDDFGIAGIDTVGRGRSLTDQTGRVKSLTDTTGRTKSLTDTKKNSIVLWDDPVYTWDSFASWDGYLP